MNKLLLAAGITLFIYFLPHKIWAQSNQTVTNGGNTTAIDFGGNGCTYNWVNSNPAIGLPGSGTGNISSFTAVNTGNSVVTSTITATPIQSGFIFAANPYTNMVSVINANTNAVVSAVQVGGGPSALSVSPDGSRVYVVNTESASISVINTSTEQVISTIPVGSYPYGVVVSPDGNTVYVANQVSNSVSVINAITNTVTSTIALPKSGPWGTSISPDGTQLFLTDYLSNSVLIVNTNNKTIKSVTVGTNPIGVTPSSAANLIYVANLNSDNVSVVNVVTNMVVATIPVGSQPMGVTISPDGTRVYVTNTGSNTVSVIDAMTNNVISTIPVGQIPEGISISPDGRLVYVLNTNDNTMSVINTSTNLVSATSNVSNGQYCIGNFVSGCSPVTYNITVNAASPTITATLPIGIISACAGTASAGTNVQQFNISGSNLIADIVATAPAGFEVSLSAGNGYSNSVTLTQSAGSLNNIPVFVRSAASNSAGSINGNVVLSSTGAANQNVSVSGTIVALPTVNSVTNQTLTNGAATTAINFTGTGNTFNWTNDTPGIGLPASGSGDISSFPAVNTGTSPVTATITVTPAPKTSGFAYSANFGFNDVDVINTTTNKVVATIPVGTTPLGAVLNPDGSRLYVVNAGSASYSISVINTANNLVIATIPVGSDPANAIVSPDGSTLYVVNLIANTVIEISTATNTIVSSIPVPPNPYCIAVSPDGRRLYLTYGNAATNLFTVVDVASNTVISSIPVSYGTFGIAVSPDGKTVYMAGHSAGTITVIDAATISVKATTQVGGGPYAVVVSPDGSRLYASNGNSINVINTSTNTVITDISGIGGSYGISVSPDGSLLYVTSPGASAVWAISTLTNSIIARIDVGDNPYSFSNFVSGGSTCSGTPVTFTITVNPSASPLIAPGNSPAPLTTTYGTASAFGSFSLSGTNMTGGILVSPPPGFEVSTDKVTFSSTVTIGTAGTIAATSVFIRLKSSTPVGSYSGNIVLSSLGATSISVVMANSTVNPAPLTITADNKTKIFGAMNPLLTATYSGFVNFETPAQLTLPARLTTLAVTNSPVGKYPIIVSGAMSSNYTITSIDGTLTIGPEDETLIIPNAFTPNGDNINDTWNITNLNFYLNSVIYIYNRWGQKVFSSIGYGTAWDGTYKGSALPVGTYYYVINLKNGRAPLSGYVTIIK